MEKLENKINALLNEHGLQAIVSSLVENFDRQADFANLSGDKRAEDSHRKVAVVLFDVLRKVDGLQ